VAKHTRSGTESDNGEERLRALIREAHESAQEVRGAIRELGRLRDDLEQSVIARVEKKTQQRFEIHERTRTRHEAKLVREIEGCAAMLSEMTARFVGVKTWQEASDYLTTQMIKNMTPAVIHAFIEAAEPLVAKTVENLFDEQLAKPAGEPFTDLAKTDKPGGLRIVTNPR
jgi:hypothetical protein